MSPVVFLVGFVGLSLLGAAILWLRDRVPKSMEAQIEAFAKEMDALSPGSPLDRRHRGMPQRRTRGLGAG